MREASRGCRLHTLDTGTYEPFTPSKPKRPSNGTCTGPRSCSAWVTGVENPQTGKGESMSTIEQMFETHPRPVRSDGHLAAVCVEACFECVQVCTTCADACLAESDAALAQCIRLNLDCADVCDAT